MTLRLMLYAAMAILISVSAFAQTKTETPTASQATDYSARLESSATQIRTGIQTLEAQMAAASPEERTAYDRQIVALKKQGEIDRLHILLDWANADGDAARASEIQTALGHWSAPVNSPRLPENAKGPRAAAGAALKPTTTSK